MEGPTLVENDNLADARNMNAGRQEVVGLISKCASTILIERGANYESQRKRQGHVTET